MRLVACSNCHTQYDVTDVIAKSIPCRCGSEIENVPLRPIAARIARCGSCGAGVLSEASTCQYCGCEIIRELGDHSLICPECFARSPDASRFCTGCGVAFRPERVRIQGHELVCPACSTLMPARQVSGVGLNECLACHGLWAPDDSFDLLVGRAIEARQQASAAELQQLRPRVTGSNPSRQSVQYRKCPECDAQMHRSNYRKTSGVIIDSCAEHGIWLDADELEQIAGFILSGAAGERPAADSAARRRQRAASAAAIARATLPLELERLDRAASAVGHSGIAVESVVNLLCKILK